MGLGDEIMAAGVAEKLSRERGPVAIVDKNGNPRKHRVWEGNPAIDANSEVFLYNHPGSRGYIERWEGKRSIFNLSYRNRDHPGMIYVPPSIREWASQFSVGIVIEPNVFKPSSPNKDWGFEKWQKVADHFGNVTQIGPDRDRPVLDGARFIETEDVMKAAAIIERAALVLTAEGGVHHMAGAVGTPAVVVYGGFTHPSITGYDGHTNLYVDGPESPCGWFQRCEHCRIALNSITIDDVIRSAEEKHGVVD